MAIIQPAYANVKLLCPFTGTNGSTPSNVDLKGNTPTWEGNAQISTDQSKWSSSAYKSDGTGDRIRFASSANLAPGAGAWTLDVWVFPTAFGDADGKPIYCARQAEKFLQFILTGASGTPKLELYSGGYIAQITSNIGLTLNTWTFLRAVRSQAGSTSIWVGGANNDSVTTNNSNAGPTSSMPAGVGVYVDNPNYRCFSGYMQDLRLTVGEALPGAEVPTEFFPTSDPPPVFQTNLIKTIGINAANQAAFINVAGL
jgi:hypothetical protein